MSNTIAIHQPNFFPWLGYFYKINQCDTFVFLDTVQYSNKGMHDYHYIKTPQGRFRLKIPVKCNFGENIEHVKLNSILSWQDTHLKQIEANYKKAAYFKVVFSDLIDLYQSNNDTLSEFNVNLIRFISNKFSIDTKFINSSELLVDAQDKNNRIFEICKVLNANVYYSGTGAAVYQNEVEFKNKNIELKYSTFKPFEYPQFWGKFEPNVSVVDYLMHCGYDWGRVLESQKNK
jgi:hypothetical protein